MSSGSTDQIRISDRGGLQIKSSFFAFLVDCSVCQSSASLVTIAWFFCAFAPACRVWSFQAAFYCFFLFMFSWRPHGRLISRYRERRLALWAVDSEPVPMVYLQRLCFLFLFQSKTVGWALQESSRFYESRTSSFLFFASFACDLVIAMFFLRCFCRRLTCLVLAVRTVSFIKVLGTVDNTRLPLHFSDQFFTSISILLFCFR